LPVFLSMTRLKLLRAPYGVNRSFTWRRGKGWCMGGWVVGVG
jgi:hypothetical protein